VDAVKFQTFKAKEFVSDESEIYEYETQGKKVRESMLEMFERHEFSRSEWKEIADYCRRKGIIFFSTPQNYSDLEMLIELGVPAIKVGSDDLTNLPLLERFAMRKKPMIISTGMAYLSEIDEAIRTILLINDNLIVLRCVSSYPAIMEEANLRSMRTLKTAYPNVVVGYSDHTIGTVAPIAAVAMGANVIEKHFTLDNKMYGPDHQFSADIPTLKTMVEQIRNVERAMGDGRIRPNIKELTMRRVARRSIVALKNISKGDVIRNDMVGVKRPGTGLSPKLLKYIVGKTATKEIKKNELISWQRLSI